jgi:RHS repeat-associated protein
VFGYDALNRLGHAEGPFGTINYTYDGVGNRLTKELNGQNETYTYTPGTSRLQETTGPVAYTYDANGNITGIGDKVFTYNQNNRLIRVEENSNTLGEYVYNGLGQRMIKTANGVTKVFHYDFNGNIIGESDQDGNFTYEYLYKGSTRLALVDVTSGEIFSFLNDRLGTPLMLTDSTNTVVWEGIYEPFGEAEVNPNSAVVNNFRFAGQYYDEESGLHYNWHRYYDPQTGRYLRADPIGLLGGINLFEYALNNPIFFSDPLGLDWISTSLGIASFTVNTASIVFPVLKPFGLVLSGASAGYAVYQYSICEISKSEMTITISSAVADLIGAASIKALSSAGRITAKEVVAAVVGSVTRGINTPLTIKDALKSSIEKSERQYLIP